MTESLLEEHGLKFDRDKYPTLLPDNIDVHITDGSVSMIERGSGINVHIDHRSSVKENFDLAQQSLAQAIEHQSTTGMQQPQQHLGR